VLNAGDIDIDHVVALSWAWHRGAATWTRGRRVEFANDPVNIVAVEASLNRRSLTKALTSGYHLPASAVMWLVFIGL